MNEMCDRCGPAYLGDCTNQLRAALFAQGWTIWPASEHALAPQGDECSAAGVLARAITSHGPQRLTRGSDHDHRPAKVSFHASGITHPQRATRDQLGR